MNSFLPNIRWLALPSENGGHDWFAKTLEIDSILLSQGMDLESEKVYLLFSEPPEKILEGSGQCLVARTVIGPKKEMKPPFQLIDWVAAPVWQEQVKGDTLEEILSQCLDCREKLPEGLKESFFLRIERKLSPDLKLSIEVIFHQ